MGSTLRSWDLAVNRDRRTSRGRWGMGAPAARCVPPPTTVAMAELIPDESGVSLWFPRNAKTRGGETQLHVEVQRELRSARLYPIAALAVQPNGRSMRW